MIALDEDALICDLAETYGIFNYRSLPVKLVATLSVGLREDSRIKMKASGSDVPFNTLLLAGIMDKISWIAWTKSEDGQNGINRPKSIVKSLLGTSVDNSDAVSFASGEAYEKTRQRLLQEGGIE